ncbi:MAG: outer membrane protein assembly factor BamA [Candidatus Cloacimonadota bacterium]|nr:MAG: outer membrane protein assembly factor BamA [Candidatus Cloacimonadota bacterium]PIE79273.1 MAG: outer membrane protein assembly factor BamA [Candidatus Delongbacteria bacterium]
MIRVIFIILIFLNSTILFSQSSGGLIIGDIKVTGNEGVSKDLIINTSGLSKGSRMYGEDLQYAIKKLWGLDLFSNIIIDAEQNVGDKVFLNIIVECLPRLSTIKVSGAEEVDRRDIEDVVLKYIMQGQSIRESDINRVKVSLSNLYKDKNYLLANIEIDKRITPNGRAELVINIEEGSEIYIENINFHGNYNFDKDDLLDTFQDTHEDAWWREGKYDKEKFRADKQLLKQFYENNGFRNVEIVKDSVWYNDAGDELNIDIWLTEGHKYYFGDISFEGNTINSDDKLRSVLNFEKGDEYSKEALNISLGQGLYPMYQDKGYLRSRITPQEQIVGLDTINYTFKIQEGVKARIRKINIIGNTRTSEKVIRRDFNIYPGDIFSRSKLLRSQRNAFMLNYFSNVMPDAKQVSDTEVDLEFTIDEKSTEQASTSISYSGNDGFIGTLGFAFNNFSFSKPFVRGDGQRLSTQIEFSKKYWRYSLSLEDPWLLDTPTLVGASFNYQKRKEKYSDTYLKGGSLKVGRRFAWADNWLRGIWIYNIQNVEYEDVEDDSPEEYELYNGKNITTSSITQYFIRNSMDRPEFPTRGSEFTIMTKVAGKLLGGDEEFHKHQFEFQWYQPLIKDRLVIMNQYIFGAMDKFSTSAYISAREYFFMGGSGLSGSEPLRGYDDNSIGPRSNGYYIGGKNMFKTSIELRLKFAESPMLVYGLAFFDAGNVWSDFKQADLFDLNRSAGFGIRVFMPMIGMIGLDYGYGFDKYDIDGKRYGEWLPHFRLGTNI